MRQRNWEGFSPDPYLSGIAVADTVRGIQDAGVIACTKHYIVNEQEHYRQGPPPANLTAAISSNVDDVTMHELYLWPFADAVRAGTGSIMCSYNQVNNSYGKSLGHNPFQDMMIHDDIAMACVLTHLQLARTATS